MPLRRLCGKASRGPIGVGGDMVETRRRRVRFSSLLPGPRSLLEDLGRTQPQRQLSMTFFLVRALREVETVQRKNISLPIRDQKTTRSAAGNIEGDKVLKHAATYSEELKTSSKMETMPA